MPFLSTEKFKIQYAQEGQGQPAVFLHAAASSGTQFQTIVKDLKLQLTSYLPDAFGEGKSGGGPVTQGENVLETELRWLKALLEHIGQPVHLIGHSYGGWVALHAAHTYPSWFKSLLVIEPTAFDLLWRPIDPETAPLIDALEVLRKECEHELSKGNEEAAAAKFIDYWAGQPIFATGSASRRASIVKAMPKVYEGWREILATAKQPSIYPKVKVKTTVVQGTRGPVITQWIAKKLSMVLSHARLYVIPEVGHLVPMTHPEKMTEAILHHLKWVETDVEQEYSQ